MTGTRYSLEVQPVIPARLARLNELANDLFYTWDRQVRGLFYRLDRVLWEACRHNPRVFLRRVSQQRLEEAAEDRVYMEDYNRVLSSYDTYHQTSARSGLERLLDPKEDLVAYFCSEFGFHESVQLYSGGLGILAGDHCKAASDLGIPFVAVGHALPPGLLHPDHRRSRQPDRALRTHALPGPADRAGQGQRRAKDPRAGARSSSGA